MPRRASESSPPVQWGRHTFSPYHPERRRTIRSRIVRQSRRTATQPKPPPLRKGVRPRPSHFCAFVLFGNSLWQLRYIGQRRGVSTRACALAQHDRRSFGSLPSNPCHPERRATEPRESLPSTKSKGSASGGPMCSLHVRFVRSPLQARVGCDPGGSAHLRPQIGALSWAARFPKPPSPGAR